MLFIPAMEKLIFFFFLPQSSVSHDPQKSF